MSAPTMREKILVAASQLFAAKGYRAVSMRHIAATVGMTQANLYNHFKDKEDLVRSVLAFVFNGRSSALATALEGGTNAEDRLERAISWFVTLLFEDVVAANLFFRELLAGDRDRLRFLAETIFQDSFDTLVHLLEDYLDAEDPVLTAITLTSTIIGYRQFSGIALHLQGTKPEYVDPEMIARHLMHEIRRLSHKQH